MYQPEDDFNLDESIDKLRNAGKDKSDRNESISSDRVEARKQQLEKIFLKLIAIGLGIGLILGIGVFILLTKLGLAKKPYELEREKQQPKDNTEQIQFIPNKSGQLRQSEQVK